MTNRIVFFSLAGVFLLPTAAFELNAQSDLVYVNVTLVDKGGRPLRDIDFALEAKSKEELSFSTLNVGNSRNGMASIEANRETVDKLSFFRIAYVLGNVWEADPVFNQAPKPVYDVDRKNELLPMTFHLREITPAKTASEYIELKEELRKNEEDLNNSKRYLADLENRKDSMISVINKLTSANAELKVLIAEKLQLARSQFIDSVTTEINSFKEDLLNLRQVLTPNYVRDAFIYSSTRDKMAEQIVAYGSSRNKLAKRRDARSSYIYEIWHGDEGKRSAIELSQVYSFALDTINTKYLLKLNESVFKRINDVGTQRKPRIGTSSKAVMEMRMMEPLLKKKVDQFVELSNKVLGKFRTNDKE